MSDFMTCVIAIAACVTICSCFKRYFDHKEIMADKRQPDCNCDYSDAPEPEEESEL